MNIRWLMLVLFLSVTAFSESVFIQTYRTALLNDTLYEAEFLWRNHLHLSLEQERAEKGRLNLLRSLQGTRRPTLVGVPTPGAAYEYVFDVNQLRSSSLIDDEDHDRARLFAGQDDILADIWKSEERKFQIFDRRNYLKKGRDDALIEDILEKEPLHAHDDILLLYRWERMSNNPPYTLPKRVLVGILGVSRLGPHTQSRLLTEERLKIKIDRLTPKAPKLSRVLPLHWSKRVQDLAESEVLEGDVIQLNSLLVDKSAGQHGLALLYFLAYTHGLMTTGRIIPEGQTVEINGKLYSGPMVLQPTHIVAEGYGTHNALFEQMGLTPIPVIGAPAGLFGVPGRLELNVVGATWDTFSTVFPAYLLDKHQCGDVEFATRLSYLTYQRCDGDHWLPGPLPALFDPLGGRHDGKSFSQCTAPIITSGHRPRSDTEVRLRARFDIAN